jgi:acyl-CoA synthetase (AMP-forming)/AMP-acid ligase II
LIGSSHGVGRQGRLQLRQGLLLRGGAAAFRGQARFEELTGGRIVDPETGAALPTGEVAKAWVVLAAGERAEVEELRAFCRERLAPYKVPATVEFRSEPP